MAVFETLVLDGLTLTGDPVGPLTMEAFTPAQPKQRAEYITTSDSEGAALLRTPSHENREITFRLRVAQQTTMDLALDKIGQVVDKLRKASSTDGGIPMLWTPAGSTRSVTFDVLNGEITDLPITWSGDDAGWFARSPVMTVTLAAEPYWRGTETLTSTASSSTPFVTLEVAGVTGDVPALGRLIVTDTATQSRRHLEWGIQGQFYDSATSLLVDSDNMTVTGFSGAQATRTGAYDPNAAGNNVISFTATPTVTGIAGLGTSLQHVGTFRVKARVWAADTSAGFRLAWRVGDDRLVTNTFDYARVANAWNEVDLGVIVIPPVLLGNQRWGGQIECYSRTGGVAVSLDYLELIPAGEGYGKARGPTTLETVTAFVAHDEFDQTGGALTGKAAPQGGTWAGAGDTDDYNVDATYHILTRPGVSDADVNTGRYAALGATNYTDVLVQADFWRELISAYPGVFTHRFGVLARYTDINNWLWAGIEVAYQPVSVPSIKLIKRQAGTVTTLGTFLIAVSDDAAKAGTIRLVVDASGIATVFYGPNAGFQMTDRAMRRVIVASDTALATGGALATGKPGFYDVWTGALAMSRSIDNFIAAVPTPNQVIYSGRSAQVRYDDTIRQDSAGTMYGSPPTYRGTRFLVPTGTSRVFAKARRQDVDTSTDESVTDATQIQVGWTPRGVAVPR